MTEVTGNIMSDWKNEIKSVDDVKAKYGSDLPEGKRVLVSDDLDFLW